MATLTPPVPRRGPLLALRVPVVGWSTRVSVRAVLVSAGLLVATTAVFVWSLTVGDYPVPVGDVISTLLGRGSAGNDFIIRNLRLPRGLTAMLVGVAFGLSGVIFQRLVRNPLASPDFMGINQGAATAAVFMVVVQHGDGNEVTAAAFVGAMGSAVALYLLAYKQGVSGYRLVLVGIGMNSVLIAATHYLLTQAEIYEAQRVFVWLTGSLNGRSWDHVRPLTVALLVLVPLTVGLARHLRALELGDDTGRALGTRVESTKAGLVVVGAALAATAVAAAGPIAFAALVAPQIARRLVRDQGLALFPSAACGALLLITADLVGRRVLAPTELPVGVVTGVVGAPYLLYLLARSNRIGAGG